jgi:hypothetical protein
MKLSIKRIAIVCFLLVLQKVYSQGFVNLNFESPILPFSPEFQTISANSALPGWSAYYISSGATNLTTVVAYNAVSAGGAVVGLCDTNINNPSLLPLQGSYSVLLQGSGFGTPTAASIGQTGQIPINALSLLFYQSLTVYGLQASFNGHVIPLIQTGATSRYAIMGGDISAFAGQTGQLLFSALPNAGNALLDNIQFSSAPIPEPSAFALVVLGGLLLGSRRFVIHR